MSKLKRWQEIKQEIRQDHGIPATDFYLGRQADLFTSACKRIAELEAAVEVLRKREKPKFPPFPPDSEFTEGTGLQPKRPPNIWWKIGGLLRRGKDE